MKLYVEAKPAELKEKAWLQTNDSHEYIYVQYHKYNKEWMSYMDAAIAFRIRDIKKAVLVYGPRGGFKKLQIITKEKLWEISKNHKPVIVQIIKLLKEVVPIRKEVVQHGINFNA